MRGAPVALCQPVFSRLTPRCHVRVASPIPVTAGPPRSQRLRGGFSGTLRLKNRRIQFEAGLAPSSAPAALWMFPCAEYGVRQKLCSAHCAGENRRIQFEAGLAPRALPLLCGCSLVWNTERGRSFVRHIAPEKTAESNSRRVLHLGHRAPLSLFSCVEQEARQ